MKIKTFGNLKFSEMQIFQDNKKYGHSMPCRTLRKFVKVED